MKTTDPGHKRNRPADGNPILRVYETFSSLQGESTWAGLPCFFIRLAGCNLSCRYCDTLSARDLAAGREMTVAELVALAKSSGLALVEITGGEPLLQTGTPALCRALLATGVRVLLETNGSLPFGRLPAGVIRIMDVKCPGSGESSRLHRANLAALRPQDEVKFVLTDRHDYEYARRMIRRHQLHQKTTNLLFSPAWAQLDSEELAAWIMADRLPVRLQLQLHKLIWGPECVGV